MSDRPLILITNDDGYDAPGLEVLHLAASEIGQVVVIAPAGQKSAVSHAVTINLEMSYQRIEKEGRLWRHVLDGTPADCIKLGITRLLDRVPDLIISGINPGANVGNNILYSGTVGGAREGAMLGVPSMAVSQKGAEGKEQAQHFESAAAFVAEFAPLILQNGLPKNVMLNCNVPNVPTEQLLGWKITRQGPCRYIDEMFSVESNGVPQSFRNVGISFHPAEQECTDDDELILRENSVSVTPCHFDLTCYDLLDELRAWSQD